MVGKGINKPQQGYCPTSSVSRMPSITKIKLMVAALMWRSSRLYPIVTGGQVAASITFNCVRSRWGAGGGGGGWLPTTFCFPVFFLACGFRLDRSCSCPSSWSVFLDSTARGGTVCGLHPRSNLFTHSGVLSPPTCSPYPSIHL